MDVAVVADQVRSELQSIGKSDRAVQEKRYLKSEFEHYGVPMGELRKVAVAAVRTKPTRGELLALAESLWTVAPPVHELRMAAVEVLIKRAALLDSSDLAFAERLVRESVSWVYVDALAEKVVGALLTRDPELACTLDTWVGDPYMWIRRTAVLALLPGVRTGNPDLERLSRYGDALIEEKDFFIRKALGWVLRELSKKGHPDWVIEWVSARTGLISGVTIREAVRRLPSESAEPLLAAYKTR